MPHDKMGDVIYLMGRPLMNSYLKVALGICHAVICFALAGCGGEAPGPEEPTPEPTPEVTACCSLEDVIEVSQAGVDDELIMTSIKNSEVEVLVGAKELIALNEAGVSKPVQQVLMGEEPEAVAAANKARIAAKGPPPLRLAVTYNKGGKSFSVTNTSGRSYTGIVVTANGEFTYGLPIPLPPGNPDNIKLGSLKSSKNGHKLHHDEGIRRLTIRSDQGSWSKRF